ncbi:hypothetical protein AAFN60_03220 [Roseibacillus persicicus]
MAADGEYVDDLPPALLFHDGKSGRDSMQHPANVVFEHLVPLLHLQGLEGRKRHEVGIVHHPSLAPIIGYEPASKIAKESVETGTMAGE